MTDAHPSSDDADLIFTPGIFIIVNSEYSIPEHPHSCRVAFFASAAAASIFENSSGVGSTIASKFICTTVVRNPSGYTQRRLGIQGSVTSSPTRIILLAVCCRGLLRFANSPLILGECYCYIGL